jgi:hypothetical protein
MYSLSIKQCPNIYNLSVSLYRILCYVHATYCTFCSVVQDPLHSTAEHDAHSTADWKLKAIYLNQEFIFSILSTVQSM